MPPDAQFNPQPTALVFKSRLLPAQVFVDFARSLLARAHRQYYGGRAGNSVAARPYRVARRMQRILAYYQTAALVGLQSGRGGGNQQVAII